jgi:hypothetical protein
MMNFPQIDQDLVHNLMAALAALAALLVVWRAGRFLVARLLPRRSGQTELPPPELDLDQLAPAGPPEAGPQLQCYNVPVRLVVVVLAPVGRGSHLPATDRLPKIIDQIVPGLQAIAAAHGPRIKLWPPQLSTQGFAHALFAELPLPGNRGKGTAWCALAGRFTADGQPFLAGLILRAAAVNNLSQTILDRETQWLEILRCTP